MKAITLISGGLDSLLAAKVIKEQGVEIIPLHFKIPFCHYDKGAEEGLNRLSRLVKENLNQDLKEVDISADFLRLLESPRHGFGSNLNPCIDCKILMLAKARELMHALQASFVVTGEVLGQRPMSQHRDALGVIERQSGLEGLLVRPLSAKLMEETRAEKEKWVDRSKLLDFSGRTRRPQIKLAQALNLEGYPNAAGGCLLTDPEFSKRLKDLIVHRALTLEEIELLRFGRHFRLNSQAKLIVGRNEKEDKALERLAGEKSWLFYPPDEFAGPTSLGKGIFNNELIELSCRITLRYSDVDKFKEAGVIYREPGQNEENSINCFALGEDVLISLRI